MRARRLRIWAAVLPTSLALAGCAGGSIQLPGTTKLIDELPKVENSTRAPCWQQQQIAAQNSYLATVKDGREVVYVAPCKAAPATASAAPKPGAT